MTIGPSKPLRYIFYGGVEGAYQNQDLGNLDYLDPALGARLGGYTEGQLLIGSLAFSGEARAFIESAAPAPGTVIKIPTGLEGIDLFFPQPRVGDYDESNILGATLDIAFGGPSQPLSYLRTFVFDGADGPNVLIGATFVDMTDDDDAAARADGIWLPEDVVPLTLSGTDAGETLRGTQALNFLSGGGGDDNLFLKAGQGWIWGGFGDDSIKGGDQGDFLFGGYGDDRILGRGGDDLIRGGDGRDDLRGEQGNDTILGGSGDDSVKGGSGSDWLLGQEGADTIWGNDGVDTLRGGSGGDSLDGGSGDDEIWGDLGDDVLKGGPGRDTFVFQAGDGFDRVLDFRPGQDRVNIETDEFETYAGMRAHAEQVGSGVEISYGFESVIRLEGISLAQLREGDFFFSPTG